jgi:hypothetical protein
LHPWICIPPSIAKSITIYIFINASSSSNFSLRFVNKILLSITIATRICIHIIHEWLHHCSSFLFLITTIILLLQLLILKWRRLNLRVLCRGQSLVLKVLGLLYTWDYRTSLTTTSVAIEYSLLVIGVITKLLLYLLKVVMTTAYQLWIYTLIIIATALYPVVLIIVLYYHFWKYLRLRRIFLLSLLLVELGLLHWYHLRQIWAPSYVLKVDPVRILVIKST